MLVFNACVQFFSFFILFHSFFYNFFSAVNVVDVILLFFVCSLLFIA